MRKSLKHIILFVFILTGFVSNIFAQAPVNDECANASSIVIPLSGYGLGIYYSDSVDLTNASLQIGEIFHNVQISAGTDKKSVWFSFHLPTARSVDLALMQPGIDLSENAAGFTVYYSNSCLPALTEVPPAKLTPLNKFGSSYNPCLLPGDYLVQVSAKVNANDTIFLQLTLDDPNVLTDYDRPVDAQNIGVISAGWHNYTFEVGCQTIENAAENCPSLGLNYQEYTQSTWHVFSTDHFIDLLRWELRESYGYYTGNLQIGYNLYLGDVRGSPIASLTLVDGCGVLHPTGVSGSTPYYKGVTWLCDLLPDTTYSLQVFYHKDYSNSIDFRFYERGSGYTHSPDPSAMDPSTQLGTLSGTPAGTSYFGYDTLSCNAFIIDNVCGTVNPASGFVNFSGPNFLLATWYTFTLSDFANVRFQTDGYMGKRLFAGDVSSNCNLSPLWEFTSSNITYNCLPPGTYSVQILGRLDTITYVTHPYYNSIGRAANLSLLISSVNVANNFQLTASGEIDSVNYSASIWNPLQDAVQTFSTEAYFGCQNTVLPEGTSCTVSSRITKKAIYREIVIDTVGILTIHGGNYSYFQYRFYAGDASALATAQGAYNYGDTIHGLTPLTNCTNLYYALKVCVTPGTYTLVSFGDSTDVGRYDRPWFRFDKIYTQFYDSNAPDTLGDVTAGIQSGTVTGTLDYYSCIDNPLTIDGRIPCSGYTKQLYREFYISQPLIVNINTTSGTFRLFEGRVSDGIGTLSYDIDGYGDLGCRSSFYSNVCIPLQAGWYTVVNYGYGGIYAGPTYSGGHLGQSNNINIWTTAPLNPPNYNRPYLAYDAGITDFGLNVGTAAYPDYHQNYTFGTERLNCIADTPFTSHPLDPCQGGYDRVGYFVFEISKESFVSINGIPSTMISRVYPFDVRIDSALMMTTSPVQPCIRETDIYHYERSWWTWTGKIELCRLQPGFYTLAVLANSSHINTSYTPNIYVDTIIESRFDFANQAYDFDSIPGDSTYYYGKLGDVNPLDPLRAASNDFISCLTGAFDSDPGMADPQNLCWNGLMPYGPPESIIYPIDFNESVYDTLGTTNFPVRRNLWYSFVIDGPGKVFVQVENMTPGKLSPIMPFTVYESDVDGNLDFATVISSGEQDSLITQGLTYVLNNSTFDWWGCRLNLKEIEFVISPCEPSVKRRFYILVDQHVGLMVTDQIEVSIKYEASGSTPLRYDHYSEANVINGLNQVNPPYTTVSLINGVYSGDTASFACASKDIPDQNTCGTKTLWYKFDSDISGKLRISYTIDGLDTLFNNNEIMLFKEIIPGDSTITGLERIIPSSLTLGANQWGESCLNQGTYYIMLTACSFTIENVVPHIWLLDEFGDLCTNPVPIFLNTQGSASNSVAIDCHSIGEAYGEDGSAMGCLFGPSGYKSTWFKVNLDFNINVNLSFQLSESTTALPSQIRYRILYGTCNSMTSGPCNSDALTEFTLNCMATDSNDYYVQIVSPENATGTLTLTVNADSSANQSCEPFDPDCPVANFTVDNGCAGDPICFSNQSTQGDSIRYHWDFGILSLSNDTSNLENPCYLFPDPPPGDTIHYNVMLVVYNIITDCNDTVIIACPIYPLPYANITRDPPQDGYFVSAGANVNFFSNDSNTIIAPPSLWIWDLNNGTFSNDTNPANVVYGPADLGINIIELQLINGACTTIVFDTFYVKYEDVYRGGYYDGADSSYFASLCLPDSAWSGGFYDGHVMNEELADCPTDSAWIGGFFDGADLNKETANCPTDSAWIGGFFDGADMNKETANCPTDSAWIGGFFDGHDRAKFDAHCPPDSIFTGGVYDGHSRSILLADCPIEAVFSGGINDGAAVYMVSTCNPLPVEMLELIAFWQGNNGVLQWATATETNNKGFFVEKMLANGDFEQLAFVPGAGNSNVIQRYLWIDVDLFNKEGKIFYYRLRQIDNDGSESLSDIVSLAKTDEYISDKTLSIIRLFPNPTPYSSDINLLFHIANSESIIISVYDELGQIVFNKKMDLSKGLHIFVLPTLDLSAGSYHLQLKYKNESNTMPFIITN